MDRDFLVEDITKVEVLNCARCRLREHCKSPVPGDGPSSARVMFVGESPGVNEDKYGKPFMGKAGREFDRYLRGIGLSRSECFVTNTVKCHPEENRDPDQEELNACRYHLRDEVALVRPEIVCTMGKYATQAFLGKGFSMDRHHGIPHWGLFDLGSGEIHRCLVLPVYHPAFGLHQTAKAAVIEKDFLALRKALNGTLVPECDEILNPDYQHLDDDDLDFISAYLDDYPSCQSIDGKDCIFIDTETSVRGEPWSIQFSKDHGQGYFVFAEGERNSYAALSLLKEYIERDDVYCVLHFAKFDLRVMNMMGIEPTNVADSLIAAYLLQTEPQGLKDLAWRHHRMQMDKFRAVVRGATIGRYRRYFLRILLDEWPEPPAVQEWCPDPKMTYTIVGEWVRCSARHKDAQLCPACEGSVLVSDLAEDADCVICGGEVTKKVKGEVKTVQQKPTGFARFVEKRGKERVVVEGTEGGYWKTKQPQRIEKKVMRIMKDLADPAKDIDPLERWYNFDASTRAMVAEKLGGISPCDLSDIQFSKALYYSCRDADATARIFTSLWSRIEESGLRDTHDVDIEILPMIIDMEKSGMLINKGKFKELEEEYESKQKKIESEIEELSGRRIMVSSPDQVANLVYRHLGIKPTKFTNKNKPSTDEEAMEEVAHRHPAVKKILEWRKLEKNREFVVSIPEAADANNRVHTTISTSRTYTGRLASSKPNLMNIPARSAEGARIRSCFEAAPGTVLIGGDHGQIEMRAAGIAADDDRMRQVFIEGIDLHSFTASQIFGIPMSDVDKMRHRNPAKTVGFGVLYQISPEGLLDQLTAAGCEGWDVKGCENLIKGWFDVYDDIALYFEHKLAEARRTGFVTDYFGRRYHIPEVHSTDRGVREAGRRQCCSYPIQGFAQGIMKRGMAAMVPVYKDYQRRGYICNPLIQIHDDLMWEVSEEIAIEFCFIFKEIMETCCQFSIPLEVDPKIGYKWGEMQELKL